MKTIYLITAHTGYNYGTYLQAFALKKLLSNYSDNVEIVWQKSFGPPGRDIRIKKVLTILFRTLFHFSEYKRIREGYGNSIKYQPDKDARALFDRFSKDRLQIKEYPIRVLKKISKNQDTIGVVCGSDQIWNSSTMYPDPLYYLRFVPKEKRIAYAPSFGSDTIPDFNKRILKKYITSIPYLSIREESGKELINDLCGLNVPVMPDPSLVAEWDSFMSNNDSPDYLLVYFLDEPSNDVVLDIGFIADRLNLTIKYIYYEYKCYSLFSKASYVAAGPEEFICLIKNAQFVCTDSFHATLFSIVFNRQFFTYPRNYGLKDSQVSRINNLLCHYDLSDRYRIKSDELMPFSHIDFKVQNCILNSDKKAVYDYLDNALNN